MIEGPHTAIVHTAKVKSTYKPDEGAREFAAKLNLASRQLAGPPK
jgi:hypothetical protein